MDVTLEVSNQIKFNCFYFSYMSLLSLEETNKATKLHFKFHANLSLVLINVTW